MIHHILAIDKSLYKFGDLQFIEVHRDKANETIKDLHNSSNSDIVVFDIKQLSDWKVCIIWATVSPREHAKHRTIDDATHELTILAKSLEEVKNPIQFELLRAKALSTLKDIIHRFDLLDEIKGRNLQ